MPRRSFSLLVVLSLAAGAPFTRAAPAPSPAPEGPITVPSFGPRFKEIRDRIEVLYQYRNGNYPLPDPAINVFRPAVAAPVAETPRAAAPAEPPPDVETIVRQIVPTLRGGIYKMSDGRAYFAANTKRYREGDVIAVRFHDKPVSLTVKRIDAASVVLVLDGVEVVITSNQLKD